MAIFGPIEVYVDCDSCGASELIHVEGQTAIEGTLPRGWGEYDGHTVCGRCARIVILLWKVKDGALTVAEATDILLGETTDILLGET